MTIRAALILAILVPACRPRMPVKNIADTYWLQGTYNYTRYKVEVTRRTPGGVAVDDPNWQLSDTAIDTAIAQVEACLPKMPKRWSVGQAAIYAGGCHKWDVPRAINRAGLVIKVAPDWYVSKCSGQELFPCMVGASDCRAKGVDPEPDCPCACRQAVQWDFVVIVPPGMALLKGGIMRAVTACENPWALPLAACL